ncbi:MAG: hypothetical protein ACWA40_05885 [Planktomarina sp.]
MVLAFLASACTFTVPGAQSEQIEAPKTAVLSSGITIQGPDGYCASQGKSFFPTDPKSVVLLSCRRIEGAGAPDMTAGRVFSATALPGQIEDSRSFANALEGPDGPLILSHKDSGHVTVHGTKRTQSAVYVEVTQEGFPPSVGQRSWKAFLNLKDHVLVLTAYKGAGSSMAGETGEKNIRAFVQQVLRVNRN